MLARFLQSLRDNASDIRDFEVVLYIDADDPETAAVQMEGMTLRRIIGPRLTMGEYNTTCLAQARGEIIFLANDDLLVKTAGWDRMLLTWQENVPDRIYLAYPDEGVFRASLSTFPILSRKTCDILIHPFPVEYRRLFIDQHLFDVFHRLERLGERRKYFLDFLRFEHLNPYYRTRNSGNPHRKTLTDDITFLALRRLRVVQALRLHACIRQQALPALLSVNVEAQVPQGIREAVGKYFDGFILDSGLPWRRRLGLFSWFCLHFLMTSTRLSRFRNSGVTC